MTAAMRLMLFSVILGLGLVAPCVSARELPVPAVAVSVDRKVEGDGWYNFEISERGFGPTGGYHRKISFVAQVKQGVAVPGRFRNYEAVMTTKRAGIWRTRREPIGGYLYVFSEEGRPYADLRLLEAWDGHPVRMTSNGVHSLVVR